MSDDEEEVIAEDSETIEASDVDEAVHERADADPISDTVEEESDDDVPLSIIRDQLLQKQTKNKNAEAKWKRSVFENREEVYLDPEWQLQDHHEHWTPLNYFLEYFPDEFWENLSEQSNIRAMQANEKKPLKSTAKEYRTLTGIHILMGIFGLPRLRLYFIKGIEISSITQLPRDRIFKLRNFLHVVNNLSVSNEVKKSNRLWKVQPIIDAVRRKCVTLPRSKELSIDEQMIPFTGTTTLRQYVKNKPNPVGLKNFVLATPSGLVLDFMIYQGAKTWPDGSPDQNLGIGGSVVKKLSADLSPGHIIYFDRYFTSVSLLDHLLIQGKLGTGTIMNNRIPRDTK